VVNKPKITKNHSVFASFDLVINAYKNKCCHFSPPIISRIIPAVKNNNVTHAYIWRKSVILLYRKLKFL